MIAVINNFITQEKADKILSTLPFSELKSKRSDHPNELADYHISSGIPEIYDDIISRLVEEGHFKDRPNAITINEYLIDQAIEPHIDDITYGDKIAVITLVGTSNIVFDKEDDTKYICLNPLSLIYWNGEHRWEYTHEIPPVSERRISIVLRKQLC